MTVKWSVRTPWPLDKRLTTPNPYQIRRISRKWHTYKFELGDVDKHEKVKELACQQYSNLSEFSGANLGKNLNEISQQISLLEL